VRTLSYFFTHCASAVVVAAGLALTACGGGSGGQVDNLIDAPEPSGAVQLMITVDWEGDDLLDENIEAMEAFRQQFPALPLVQFLNAAYFEKPGADRDDVRARIARTVRDRDELGLHIHGWKRLFEAAGVTHRESPTFWGPSYGIGSCAYDCGHEVPISAYEKDELQKVIRFSVETLEGQGLGRAVSFRAGGWMAEQHVREALELEGFAYESSAVPAHFLEGEIGHLPLHRWVEALWDGTTKASQPYALDGLTEVPDNGALADYVTGDEMFDVYLEAKRLWQEDPSRNIIVNIGFHQETADKYLPRVEDACTRIVADAEADGVALQPIVATDVPPAEQ
jgi:hypothetical protein